MKKWAILAAAAIVLGAATAQAGGYDRSGAVVEGWYRQYLGRCADQSGLCSWGDQLRRGKGPDCVLAGILASDEYYRRNGCCDAGFIKGLYHDRLGRCASDAEVREWLCNLQRCGSRERLALDFLAASQRELCQR
jgi:hypothetical protein